MNNQQTQLGTCDTPTSQQATRNTNQLFIAFVDNWKQEFARCSCNNTHCMVIFRSLILGSDQQIPQLQKKKSASRDAEITGNLSLIINFNLKNPQYHV